MSDDKLNQDYSDPIEIYRRKQAHRKHEAKRPVSEKMATVIRLRDFERALENVRKVKQSKTRDKRDYDKN